MAKNDISKRKLKGYYKFSKNYPLPDGTESTISETPKMVKRQRTRRLSAVIAVCCVFVLAFIAVTFCLKLASRPLPETPEDDGLVITAENIGAVRAIYIDNSTFGEISALSQALTEAKKNGFNAVMADFKTREGYITYASRISKYSNTQEYNEIDSVIIDKIKEEGFMLIARVYCFEDGIAPQRINAFVAEDEERTKIWLDAPAVEDGSPWLDPTSDVAVSYLCSVIGEIKAIGVDCIYLQSVQFPAAREGVPMFLSDSSEEINRNARLLEFIENAVKTAGDMPVMVGVPIEGAEGGNAELWGGTLFDTAASVCSPYMEALDGSDYISYIGEKYISLNENVKNNFSTIRAIPTVKNQPSDADFYKKIAQSEAESYIIVP